MAPRFCGPEFSKPDMTDACAFIAIAEIKVGAVQFATTSVALMCQRAAHVNVCIYFPSWGHQVAKPL